MHGTITIHCHRLSLEAMQKIVQALAGNETTDNMIFELMACLVMASMALPRACYTEVEYYFYNKQFYVLPIYLVITLNG